MDNLRLAHKMAQGKTWYADVRMVDGDSTNTARLAIPQKNKHTRLLHM